MCWSLEVSIGSYAIVVALTALLVRRNWANDRWFALWLFWVGQIQLAEVFLWLDQPCTGLNQAASKVLLAIIALEPVVAALLALRCTPPKQRQRWQWALAQASAVFGAALWTLSSSGTDNWCSRPCTACGSDHLAWPWVDAGVPTSYRLLFLALICAPFAAMRPLSHGAAGAGYTAAIFAISFIAFRSQTSFESMWCWLSVGGFCCPLLLSKRPAPDAPPARPAVRRPDATAAFTTSAQRTALKAR